MGRRGPKSNAPGGYGTVTAKGYRRVWCTKQRRYRMEHDVIWEQYHGPIPSGFCLHHRDKNKLNNQIENLELVSHLAHKRKHSGCKWKGDEWWKPCRKCGAWYPVSHYYKRKDGISPWCRPCCIANAVENKCKRRTVNPPNRQTNRPHALPAEAGIYAPG